MVEVKRNLAGHDNFKSLNGIILRFPQFKEGLQNIRGVFEQYGELHFSCINSFWASPAQDFLTYSLFLSLTDEDSNGSIDREELKKCLKQLQMHMTEEEVEDLFHSCDIDGSAGIQFNEFIVLLCLIYLLKDQHSPTVRTNKLLSLHFRSVFNLFIILGHNVTILEVYYRNQSWVHLNLKQPLTQSSKLSYFSIKMAMASSTKKKWSRLWMRLLHARDLLHALHRLDSVLLPSLKILHICFCLTNRSRKFKYVEHIWLKSNTYSFELNTIFHL